MSKNEMMITIAQIVKKEYPDSKKDKIIDKLRKYEIDDIERCLDAMQRFGAKSVFESIM